MLVVRNDKPNKHNTKHLYINNESLYLLVLEQLGNFQKSFFSYLGKLMQQYNESYMYIKVLSSIKQPYDDLLEKLKTTHSTIMELVLTFYEIVDVYTFYSILVWPIDIQDKDSLKKLISSVFSRIVDIQIQMVESVRSLKVDKFNPLKTMPDSNNWPAISARIYSTEKLVRHLDQFKKSNMTEDGELLLDLIWKIKKDVKKKAYPEPAEYGWDFDYQKDDWRKLLQLQKEHPDQTHDHYINIEEEQIKAALKQ